MVERSVMVVKIQPATASASHAVDYNEEKVAEGVAQVVFSSGIADVRDPMATFSLYENASGSGRLGFHVSVNPSDEDFKRMSEAQMLEFMKEWMDRMGYGNQPYIIYAHNDIGRPHYHIVSVRCDFEGHKIDEWRERTRSRDILRQMESRYGFKLGKGSAKAEEISMDTRDKVHGQQDLRPVGRFNPANGAVAPQVERLVSNAMEYHFTTENQFILLMRDMGVHVSIEEKRGKTKMYFSGIDPATGKICTARINGSKLNVPTYRALSDYMEACKREVKKKECSRVSNIAAFCLRHSRTEVHFSRMLARKNMSVRYAFDSADRLFGATFIDHQTRCVFKCSELDGKKLKLSDIERTMAETWPPFNHSDEPRQMTGEQSDAVDRDIDKFAEKLSEFTSAVLNNNTGQQRQDIKRNNEAKKRKRTIYG